MLSNLKLILGAVLGVMLFGGGYALGGRKVAELEAQIEKAKDAGETAAAMRVKAQAEIDKALKEQGAEHARQLENQKADAERRSKELGVALAGANARIAQLQAQVNAINARRAQLVADMAAASEAEKKKLQDQIDALDREKRVLVGKVDANECLAFAVPESVINPLVR